ncbi:MAG: hypothetical protein QXV32_03760 [Conexivisphaerales archaeon]
MNPYRVILLAAVLLSLALALAYPTTYSRAQQEAPFFNVVYEVTLGQHYSLFGSVDHTVNLQLQGHIVPFNSSNLKITVIYSFTLTGVVGLPKGANFTASQGFYGINKLVVTFPEGVQDFNFIVKGTINDPSIFYRDVADIPAVTVSANGPPYIPAPFGILVPQTAGMQIYSVYPSPNPKSVSNQVLINGHLYYSIEATGNPRYVEILYQQPYRDVFVFLYLAAFAAVVPIIILLYRNYRVYWSKATNFAREKIGDPLIGNGLTNNSSRSKLRIIRLKLKLRPFNSKKWLGFFVLSAVLMIGFAFLFGPSPTPRAYLASTPGTTPAIAPYIQAANWTYLTPLQVTGTDKFDTMSTLGAFDAIILADYPPPLDTEGLTSAYHIIVLTQYVNKNDSTVLQQLYPSYTLIFLNNVSQLTKTLSTIHPRTNPLGMVTPESIYVPVVLFEAVMSFVIVFFALGFLSSAIIEGSKKGLGGIAEAVAFSVLTFLFAQMVYIVTTVFLGIPVGLHASTSHDTTAVGMLGFGGGTRPRMLSGSLGFLLGILTTKEARSKLDFIGFFAFVGAGLFILVDPGNLGNLFSQLVLATLSGVPTLGAGGQTYEGIRHIIGTFMQLFGDNATVNYYSQHGAAAFYAGVIPFALFSRLGKSSATFLALFSAYVAGTGFVRISDMIPLKAMASVIPGVALGAVILIIFVGLGLLEWFIRKHIVNK